MIAFGEKDTKQIPLRIEPAPNGGFIVSEASNSDYSRVNPTLLACSSIDEALAFIKGRLAPEGSEERKRYNAALNQAPNLIPDPNSSSGMRVA